MDLLQLIGLLGSLVSIGGAIWASISVGIIKKAKDEVFARLKIVKYSELTSSSKGTIIQLRKVVNKKRILPGVNFDDINGSINDYYENLNKIKNDITEDGYTKLDEQMNKLKSKMSLAIKTDRKSSNQLIEAYTEIYYHVLEIDSEIANYNKKIIEK